ncbi:hypothetical protein OAC41_02200 [Acidimicrobiales bacterium]|nr:hypothetical protein [Acidimicrobiales bacterium]
MALADDDVRAALAEVIGSGAIPRAELEDRLSDAGYRIRTRDVDHQLQFDTHFVELRDGVAHIPSLTDGVAFSLWVDAETAAEGFVLMYPALEAIGWWIVGGPVDLYDESGEPVGPIESDGWLIDGVDTDVVLGPDGWLHGFAGSWIAFRVRNGALVVERLADPPPADAARVDSLRAAFEAVAEHQHCQPYGADDPVDVERAQLSTIMQEAILHDRPLFAGEPLPPPGERAKPRTRFSPIPISASGVALFASRYLSADEIRLCTCFTDGGCASFCRRRGGVASVATLCWSQPHFTACLSPRRMIECI